MQNNIRKEIINYLSSLPVHEGQIQDLTFCFQEETEIDQWLKGVINSLYYKPNEKLLVLKGEQGTGKTYFLCHLLPDNLKEYFGVDIYTNLIIDATHFNEKLLLHRVRQHNFFFSNGIYTKSASVDKRLASYATTTNTEWKRGNKKSIIINMDGFNKELFNSIDKQLLWGEIFNRYKK